MSRSRNLLRSIRLGSELFRGGMYGLREIEGVGTPISVNNLCTSFLRISAAIGSPYENWGLITFGTRCLSGSSQRSQASVKDRHERETGKNAPSGKEGLVINEEEFSAITDKIPQRPVSVAEGTSYSVVIIAALGFAAAVIYAAGKELLFSPKEYQCYTISVERLKQDPRVTVRLGSPISAYGTESQNRAARQRIPHRVYNDTHGREHVQLQFQLRGPSGRATVNADMYLEEGNWRYYFLYLDVQSPLKQEVVLVSPGQTDLF